MRLSLVSGTYNRLDYLQRMIASARASAGEAIEFCIVDGGSTDGTQAWCQTQDDICLVEQNELRGATQAFAAGFAIATGQYVIVANDDVEFVDDTIKRSAEYLDGASETGAVAYQNRYTDGRSAYLQSPYGYLTPQCGIVRKWVGDLVGWWSTDYHTYAADTEMGLKIWELGLRVDALENCAIVDAQPLDELRKINSGAPDRNTDHPDNVLFLSRWKNRIPNPQAWLPPKRPTILQKAMQGKLRTLRFKTHPPGSGPVRTGMIQAFEKLGDAKQVVQDEYARRLKASKFQAWVENEVEAFGPADIVMFQAQGIGTVLPQTVKKLRGLYPDTLFVNFNGDVRNSVEPVLLALARECHLSLLASPDLFASYGDAPVAYWPIAVDPEYMVGKRIEPPQWDAVFLGSNYPGFPLSDERLAIVTALHDSDLRFGLFGFGWPDGWAQKYTADNTQENVKIYADAKLAVSISQFDLWGYTSDRLYRICATGCPAVVKRFRGISEHGFRDRETCFVFDDAARVVELCRSVLADPAACAQVGRAGRDLILARHNYDARVWALLAMLERL